jgi:tetratricopeptide (TPR) repeat protein
MNSKRAYLVLIAAVAGAPFLATPASAQIRVDTAGHALDANPQIGSGGYNSPNPNVPLWTQYQNALATNNDAGAYGFRGRSFNGVNMGVGYTDPFAFRGLLAGQGVDQFISASTGVPTMADPTASSGNYAAPPNPSGLYYGSSNHVNAPPGFQPSPDQLGYVPQQTQVQSSQDSRLGTIDYSGSGQVIPKPYEMILPGPVDPTANPATQAQQMLAANPIFGVVNWSMTPVGQQTGGQTGSQTASIFGQTPLQQGIAPQVAQGLTVEQVRDLRQQLNNDRLNVSPNQTNSQNGGAKPPSPTSAGIANSSSDQSLSALNSGSSQLNGANLSPAPGGFATGQSTRQYPDINLPPPSQQSAQYAKLRQSIQEYNSTHWMTDEQANQKFQQILRLREQASVAAENGGDVLTGSGTSGEANPPGVPSPEQPVSPIPGPFIGTGTAKEDHAVRPGLNTVPDMGVGSGMAVPPASAAPVPIEDFAKDIPAKGLADLIAGGDVYMKKGQYDKAITAYNQAIDVVPNNPLILVARAIAELGGGYYSQAYADLHVAISEDPAVLMGQYDLQKQIGEPRVKAIIGELKDIATSSKDNTLHSFLLTFCYYNSNHVGQAADWLQITDRRGGGQDPAIVQMKKYWNFNDETPATQPAEAK